MKKSGNGYLKVRVTRERGAYPAVGAEVTVWAHGTEREEDGEVLYTGAGGVTETVMLPAPRASESQTPGTKTPYAIYDVSVRHEGSCPVTAYSLPVFDKVTSVKTFDLLPEENDG